MFRIFLSIFCGSLLCFISSCHTTVQDSATVQNEVQSEMIAGNYVHQEHSISATEITQAPRFGAMITKSKVVANDNLEYFCKIWFASDTLKAIRGFEILNYHDNGGLHNMYNLRRSIKPLGKLKLAIAPHGKATVSFPVISSNVNPVISKIFYKDGSIQRTVYDVLGSEFEQPTLNGVQMNRTMGN